MHDSILPLFLLSCSSTPAESSAQLPAERGGQQLITSLISPHSKEPTMAAVLLLSPVQVSGILGAEMTYDDVAKKTVKVCPGTNHRLTKMGVIT